MKWKVKQPKPEPKIGERKTKRVFLWTPFTQDDERYWLEFVDMECIYFADIFGLTGWTYLKIIK